MIENLFSTPQRQSAIGIVVIFFYTLQKNIRAWLPILIISIVKYESGNLFKMVAIAAGIIIIIGVIAYLNYRNFKFYIDKENREFILYDGIINKTKTSIQLSKIQQVNINQSIIQKIFNVFEVQIDTAGSEKSEVNIRAVSQKMAIHLKEQLLVIDQENLLFEDDVKENLTKEVPENFLNISFLTLLKVGITSNYVKSLGLILFVLYNIYDYQKDLGEDYAIDDESILNFFSSEIFILNVFKFIGVLILIIFIVNIGRTVFKFFNFQVRKQAGSLQLTYGLLSTRSTIIKPQRVQILGVSQNYFQKKFDIAQIYIKQVMSEEQKNKNMAIEVPGCNFIEKNNILELIYDKVPKKGVELKPNIRKFILSFLFGIILPLGIYLFLAQFWDTMLWDYVHYAPLYFLFVILLIYFGFRNYRLYIDENYIIKQSGAWDITQEILEPKKIQSITVSQLFWQKKADIGSITLKTAGGNLHFQAANYTELKKFTDLWLYKIERSNENWM